MRPTSARPLIDELLDGGATPERSQEIRAELRRDPVVCEELARTRLALDKLAEPLDAPDLTQAILGRVHARRRFLPQRLRRTVTAGRLGVAAGLVGAVGVASFLQRHAPEVQVTKDPAPVSRLVEAAAPKDASPPDLAAQTVESIQASLSTPTRLTLSPRIRPEDSLHFDLSIDRGNTGPSVPMRAMPPTHGPHVWSWAATDRPASPEPQGQLLSRFRPVLVFLREPPSPPTSLDVSDPPR